MPYEEEILRNPFSVKHWLRYIDHKKGSPRHTVNVIFERALKELPGRYAVLRKSITYPNETQVRMKSISALNQLLGSGHIEKSAGPNVLADARCLQLSSSW